MNNILVDFLRSCIERFYFLTKQKINLLSNFSTLNRSIFPGPPLAGVLVDKMEDNGLALDMSGLLLLLSTTMCLAAIFRYQFTRRRAEYQQLA